MKRRLFIRNTATSVAGAVVVPTFVQSSVFGKIMQNKTFNYCVDQFIPIAMANVKVGGEIGRRIDITVANNLLKLNIDKDFLDSFKKKDSSRLFVGLGMLIDSAVRMAYYTGDSKLVTLKNHLVEEIKKTQEPDGYLGNQLPQKRMWTLWDIHEMGYIIYGLTSDFTLFGNKKSLEAAKKGAEYIIKNWAFFPKNWENTTKVATHVGITGIHYTMLKLFDITKDHFYLEFCLNQLNLKNWNPGIVVGRRNLIEGHVYGYMASCLSQLELYRKYPEEKLLSSTMEAINFMTSQDGMTITGGVGQVEIWTDDQHGRNHLGETCATAYQLRVYDNLLRLKGDSRYGDIMERTIYNALFGAQSPDGRHIRYYTPFEGNREYYPGDTYCCPCNYRRIISDLPSMIYYQTGKGVAINLYSSSEANITIDTGLSIAIRQETDYPSSGHIMIRVDPSKPSSFPLKLRIPSWCKNARIIVNGIPLDTKCTSGTFAVIERTWKKNDQIVLDMPMAWRLVKGRQRQAGRVAVMRGPMIFGLNPEQNESLAKKDGADLGWITIDIDSIEYKPVPNNSVRPDGVACRLKAGSKLHDFDNPGNLTLTFTEFADPDIKCIYFKVPDLSKALADELIGLQK